MNIKTLVNKDSLDLYTQGQLIFDEHTNVIQWGEKSLFNNSISGASTTQYMEKDEVRLISHSIYKY